MRFINRCLISAFLISVTGFVAFNADAQTLTTRFSPQVMEGIRPVTMGGAFIATDGIDENAIFYNPAMINDYEKKVHMQFFLPTIQISYKAVQFLLNDLTDQLIDPINAATTDSAKINAFQTFFNTHVGRYEELEASGNIVSFMHKYITASLFYDSRTVIGLINPASATVDIEAVTHGGLALGSAYGFFDGNIQLGAAVKFVARHRIDETITQRDIVSTDNFGDVLTYDQVGYGIGVDLGLQAKIPFEYKWWEYLDPTFAVSAQDIGDNRLSFGDNVGRIESSTTLGLALHPNFWKLRNTFAVDWRDIEHDRDFLNRTHLGLEVAWPDFTKILREISIRGGLNQGYATGGLGLDFRFFKMNLGTWGREVSQQTRQKESRMLGVQLAAGF